jgi:DNA-directed RNA polymerase subunit K/omega
MIHRTAGMNPFEFVTMAALRAAQLIRGCAARVPEAHKRTTTAQKEVAAGMVVLLARETKPNGPVLRKERA